MNVSWCWIAINFHNCVNLQLWLNHVLTMTHPWSFLLCTGNHPGRLFPNPLSAANPPDRWLLLFFQACSGSPWRCCDPINISLHSRSRQGCPALSCSLVSPFRSWKRNVQKNSFDAGWKLVFNKRPYRISVLFCYICWPRDAIFFITGHIVGAWALTHAVHLHNSDVQAHEVIQSFFTDGCGTCGADPALVQPQSSMHLLKHQIISQHEGPRHHLLSVDSRSWIDRLNCKTSFSIRNKKNIWFYILNIFIYTVYIEYIIHNIIW